MNAPVIDHLERHLGQIQRGWAPLEEPIGVQVCVFPEQPAPHISTFATVGLSGHVLALPRDREVRQELLISIRNARNAADISQLMLHIAQEIADQHRAVLRGEIISLGHPIRPKSVLTCVYASIPVVFPHDLATCTTTSPETIFAWLIPISQSEASFVRLHGWNQFEDILEHANPDLFDLCRSPIV